MAYLGKQIDLKCKRAGREDVNILHVEFLEAGMLVKIGSQRVWLLSRHKTALQILIAMGRAEAHKLLPTTKNGIGEVFGRQNKKFTKGRGKNMIPSKLLRA